MGLFSEYLSSIKISDLKPIKKAINEAEVDGVQQAQEGEASEDYTATEDTTAKDTQPAEGEANTEEQPAEDNAGTEDQGGDDSTDYTEDIGDLGGDDSMSGDDTGDTSSDTDSDTSTGSDEEAKIDELKKQEEELYSNLTPEQLDLRHKELKEQYLSMYDLIVSILDRINEASVDEEKVEIVKYISDTLENLKKMIVDYMKYSYKMKSYIENSINYNRFLAVLNGMNKILEEMNKTEDK